MNGSGFYGAMVQTCAVDFFKQSTTEFLSLFYIIDIHESIKDKAEDVPNYEIMVCPKFIFPCSLRH